MKKKPTPKISKRVKKSALKMALTVMAIGTLFLFIFILSVKIGVFGKLPKEIDLKQVRNNQASEIVSVDNKLLGRFYYQNRTDASIDDVPKYLIDALVATEDVRFYRHNGVDFRSTMRVIVKSLILRNKSAGGGSTISQQLAKNLYPRKNHGFLSMPVAKCKEIITAKRLEKVYTKNEILELYLNTVSFGENTYGIETAALVYFSKETAQLNRQEAALLVGLLKANTSYNPRIHKEASKNRRNTVLQQMQNFDYLSEAETDSLQALPVELKFQKLSHNDGLAPYFREQLRHELTDILKGLKKTDGSEYNLYSDGLTIYTTVNHTMQTMAEQAVKEHLQELQILFDKHWKGREPWKKNLDIAQLPIKQSQCYQHYVKSGLTHEQTIDKMKEPRATTVFDWSGENDTILSPLDSVLHHFKTLQTGMLVMNPKNGDVLVWVGGTNYKFFKYDHIKSKRQAGSIFKPIVYATALQKGTAPCTMYANDSTVYADYDNWTPQNADRKFGGFYSMKGALANSVNTVSAKLIMEVGIDETIEQAERMGIKSDLPEVPSLALGTGELSLHEIVQAYCTFSNGGRSVTPRMIRRVEDARGQVIYSNGAHELGDSVMTAETAQTMMAMMQGTVDRGTATSIRRTWGLHNEIAGKTGTTQQQTDGWFVSMTPNLTMGVWVGGDNPAVRFRSLALGQGGYMALPITARFLKKLYEDPLYKYMKNASFNIPQDIYANMECDDYAELVKMNPIIDVSIIKEEGVGEFVKDVFSKNPKEKKKKNKWWKKKKK